MKYYILSLALLFSLTASAQDYDSLTQRILKLEANQKSIQVNVGKAHRQFSTGTMFLISGVTTTIVAGLLYDRGLRNTSTSDEQGTVVPSPVLLCIGGGLMTAGTVIQIDSHKWFRRAARRRK